MKNQKQPHNQADWRRCPVILLLIPFLLLSLGATVKQPASAKQSASQKTRQKLKKLPWIGEADTFKGHIVILDARIAELQNRNKSLKDQIRQTNARITQGASNSAADKMFRPQPGGDQTGASAQPDKVQPAGGQTGASVQPDKVQPAGGQATTEIRGARTPADLPKQQAYLQETQSLLAQYKSARQQWQDATLGSEANYQALLAGDLKKSGGFYAQRVFLDEEARTEFIPDGPCGDYPGEWCNAPPDSVIHFGGSAFLNRQCVTYAAWKRWKNGQKFATGNAGDWPGNSPKPTVGSVAIWNAGTVGRYGHVAYVTAVTKDSITISEFNWQPFLHSSRVIGLGSRGWPSRFWN